MYFSIKLLFFVEGLCSESNVMPQCCFVLHKSRTLGGAGFIGTLFCGGDVINFIMSFIMIPR